MISVSTVDALPPMSSSTRPSPLVRECVCVWASVFLPVRVCCTNCSDTTPMEVAATPSQCLSKLLFFTLTQFNEFVKITFGTLCLLIDDVAVAVTVSRQPLQTVLSATLSASHVLASNSICLHCVNPVISSRRHPHHTNPFGETVASSAQCK